MAKEGLLYAGVGLFFTGFLYMALRKKTAIDPPVTVGRSAIHGKGLFLTKDAKPGMTVFEMGDLNKYADGGSWITELGGLVNHKKDANAEVYEKRGRAYLRVTKPIRAGEELTINYKQLPFPFKSDTDGFKE